MFQLARFNVLSFPADAASVWRELVRAYRGSAQELDFVRAVLTTREGMVVLFLVLQYTEVDADDPGEYINFLFEALAKHGTPEEMLTCIRLGQVIQESWKEEPRVRALTSTHSDLFTIADAFGQYLTWLWSALSQRDLKTADDALLVLSWSFHYQDDDGMPEYSMDAEAMSVALLRKGHRSRAKVHPHRATAAEIRRYFGEPSDDWANRHVRRSVLRLLSAMLRSQDKKGV